MDDPSLNVRMDGAWLMWTGGLRNQRFTEQRGRGRNADACIRFAKTEQEQRVSSWERETESWLRAEIAGHVLKALQVNCVDQQRWKAGCWAEGLMLTLGKPLPLSGEVERGKSSTGSQVEEDGRKKGPSLAKYQGASRMQLLYSLHSFP